MPRTSRHQFIGSKEWMFCQEYVKFWDPVKALVAIGYDPSKAGRLAPSWMKKPEVRDYLKNWFEARSVGTEVIKEWLMEVIRGDVYEYAVINPDGSMGFDMNRLKDDHRLYLLKSVTVSSKGRVNIETHDRGLYIDRLARVMGLYNDAELKGAVESLRDLLKAPDRRLQAGSPQQLPASTDEDEGGTAIDAPFTPDSDPDPSDDYEEGGPLE